MTTSILPQRPAAVLLLALAALVFAFPAVSQDRAPSAVTVEQLALSPRAYVYREIAVQGKLTYTGGNYHRDPRFALEDAAGNRIEVSAWLPLEIPPLPPGAQASNRPLTMQDVLGQEVEVSGTVLEMGPARFFLQAREGRRAVTLPGSPRN